MKTLLQINTVINSGSTGRIAEDIGQLVISKGWESYIAYGRNDKESKSEKIKIGSKFDILWHVLMTRIFDKHGFFSKISTRKLIKEIKRIKPDIIHLHNIHGYFINIELLFNYLSNAKIPVIWTLHDCWSFTGHCTHFAYVGCEKWKTQCSECPQRKEYPASIFIDRSHQNYINKKKVFNSVDNLQIVTVSKWLENTLRQSFLKNKKIFTINNGIDLNVFQPNEDIHTVKSRFNLDNKFILLAVASVWIEKKGLYELIKLSNFLVENEILVLVGQIKENVKLPSNILNIQRIEVLEELADLYSCSNVVMNLSFQETFGMTTVEGFACGTPSIVYKCTASPELIKDKTGFIITPGDFHAIREALNIIKINKREYYLENCRSRAVEFYNKNERYNEYISLYEDLFNTKKLN